MVKPLLVVQSGYLVYEMHGSAISVHCGDFLRLENTVDGHREVSGRIEMDKDGEYFFAGSDTYINNVGWKVLEHHNRIGQERISCEEQER